MISLPFFKEKTSIGLHIEEDEVRFLQLKWLKKEIRIEQLAVVELPPGAVIEGEIVEMASVQATVAQVVAMTKTEGDTAIIAMPAKLAMMESISLSDDLTEEVCEARMMSHFSQVYPSGEALCFDFVIVNRAAYRQSVLGVAVKQYQLSRYVNVVREAGLDVKIVDIDSYAIDRAKALSVNGNNPLLSMMRSPFVDESALFNCAPRMMASLGLALRGIS